MSDLKHADEILHEYAQPHSMIDNGNLFFAGTEYQKAYRELEQKLYVPGNFKCAKCGLNLVAQVLYTKSGNVGANNNPQECANGCGPMWKVTWKQMAEELMATVERLVEEKNAHKT